MWPCWESQPRLHRPLHTHSCKFFWTFESQSMHVLEIGRKRDVQHGNLCDTDFVLLDEIEAGDTVVILKLGKNHHCFLLTSLARWFFDHALTWNTMPRIPTTGETVTRSVYREVVHSAMQRFPEFMRMVHDEVESLSDARRAFLEGYETSVPPPPPTSPPRVTIPEHYSPPARSRGRRDSLAIYAPSGVTGRRRRIRSPRRRS